MAKRNLIGILSTEQTSLVPYQQTIYPYGTPRITTFYDKQGMLDLLVIPDNVGAYVGMSCFAKYPIGTLQLKTYCPQAENFRISETGLSYYIQKQIPIIGVGEGAIMLWNYLNGKCLVENTNIHLLKEGMENHDLLIENKIVVQFKISNFIGIKSIESSTFKEVLRNLQRISQEPRNWTEKVSEDIIPEF